MADLITMSCGRERFGASAMRERVDGFMRVLWTEPGYDCWTQPCDVKHGRHGMSLRFLLVAEEGATQFLMYTSDWLPTFEPFGAQRGETFHGPMAACLGHHWTRPLYEGESGGDPCEYLHGAPCFYDGSGLNAEPVMKRFFVEGFDGVWDELEQYHRVCSENAAKVARGEVD